ncbi:hypothetical protein BD410DRAFT_373476 [Rickenella mellea]|uniref:Uncharacterized protein n=1 Tax=Rickenella mellea TaxID=50990 RepID=A0A4Y7PZ99_9AGAM|nr:hypothetical protein BD410DRAFT_373476 [Rickenella mellea]
MNGRDRTSELRRECSARRIPMVRNAFRALLVPHLLSTLALTLVYSTKGSWANGRDIIVTTNTATEKESARGDERGIAYVEVEDGIAVRMRARIVSTRCSSRLLLIIVPTHSLEWENDTTTMTKTSARAIPVGNSEGCPPGGGLNYEGGRPNGTPQN